MEKDSVLIVDKPSFVVKLHEELLEVDLKEGAKMYLEKALEASPILRESLGLLFQTIVPLDIALYEIDTVELDEKGHLRITIPLRRDIIIPLEADESKGLVEKLNELIPLAKLKEAKRRKELEELEKRPKEKLKEPI